ncbi:MAG: transglycosylase SLT domain-containing protein, partial [Myxococcales bacterium]|nr:transglycosylase SLT domain-containing protein [Myxococcales bacterium]
LGDGLRSWLDTEQDAVDAARRRYLDERAPVAPSISRFDDLFQREAEQVGWSWPLLAAVAWQESRFRPHAVSPVGARGLMQIMPGTARDLGLSDPTEPASAVRAGARYLRQLDRRWQARIPDAQERVAFVLASYNAGIGHVEDAVELARLDGLGGDRWEEVAPWLLALAEPDWNQHPSVRYGYCRGTEPVAYVDAILGRWKAYEATLAVRPPAAPLW